MRRSPPTTQLKDLLAEWDLLVEIRSFRLKVSAGLSWVGAFKQAFDDWGFALGDAGALSRKTWQRDERGALLNRDEFGLEPLGAYRFFGPGEIALPPDLPPLECPLLPAPYGHLAVKVGWAASEESVTELVRALIKEGMGRVLASARDREQGPGAAEGAAGAPATILDVPCTTKRSFSLMLGKYSIEDGDVLLSRDDERYVGYVIDEVKMALKREGYEGELGATATCHNPFRYWQEEDRFYIFGPNGSRPGQRELEAFLYRHTFEIWVFDFDAVDRLARSVEASIMWP